MDRNNQTEFYSIITPYHAAYTGYQPQDAKKQAEAVWTKLKDDYIMGMFCFMVCFCGGELYIIIIFISNKSSDKLT